MCASVLYAHFRFCSPILDQMSNFVVLLFAQFSYPGEFAEVHLDSTATEKNELDTLILARFDELHLQ